MRKEEEINREYYQLCAEIGHFFVNAVFKNEGMLQKFKTFKALDREHADILANKETK